MIAELSDGPRAFHEQVQAVLAVLERAPDERRTDITNRPSKSSGRSAVLLGSEHVALAALNK